MLKKSNFETEVLSGERKLGRHLFSISKNKDYSANLRNHLAFLVDCAGEDGFASKLDFYIIRTENLKPTKANTILSLTNIPIIPPIFDPSPYTGNRERNYTKFARELKTLPSENANDRDLENKLAEKIQTLYEGLDPEQREININCTADLIMSYILGEVAKRYSIAKENKEIAVMEQLKSLKFIQAEGFDLDMFDLVLRTPGGLKNRNGEKCLSFVEDGRTVTLYPTDEEIADYKFNQHMRDQCFDAGRFYVQKFSRDLDIGKNNNTTFSSDYPKEPIT